MSIFRFTYLFLNSWLLVIFAPTFLNGNILKKQTEIDLLHEDGSLYLLYPDLGETVSVNFVTNLRNKRDLAAQNHHVIQFRIKSDSRPVTFHLSRNPMSVAVKDEESEWTEQTDCIYTGVMSGGNGSAVFSACSSSHAFTGHFILEDEHYVLEPASHHPRQNMFQSGSEIKHEVLHRIYRTADISAKENSSALSDSLAVPFEDIEKDLKDMGIALSTKDKATDETSSPLERPHDDDAEDSSQINSPLLFSKSSAEKTAKKATGSSSGSKVVDMAVFLDVPLVKKWTDKYGSNGKKQLLRFVMNILNNMNLLYQHSSLKTDVSLRLVYTEYLSQVPMELHQTDDGNAYLNSFCTWAGNKNTDGAKWDHGLLLTGLDIQSNKEYTLGGIAFFSTMCLRHLSCSIGEAKSFLSSFIMTHEIGHSLGMNHDGTEEGTGTSISCDGDKYIMASSTGKGKVTWSECSSNNLKDLLRNGIVDPRTKRHTVDHLKCLDNPSTLQNKATHFKNLKSKLPGQLYDATEQCHLDCGDHCSPYQPDKPELCSLLRCKYYPVPGSKTFNHIGYHPALEGTKCGNGKWCRHGKCVAQENSG